MQKLERQIYLGTHSREALDVHEAMILVEPGMVAFPSPAEVTSHTAKRLSNVITAYRLMDVLYALQSPSASTRNPRHAKLPQPGLLPPDKASTVLTRA
jgi:hypothetical protein